MTNSTLKNALIALTACTAISLPSLAAAGGPGIGPGNITNGNPCANNLCGGGAFPQPDPKPDPSPGKFGTGFAAGLIGAAIVNGMMQQRQPQVIVQQPVVPGNGALAYNEEHVRYCLERYDSYVIETNQYMTFGGVPKSCISPYM